MRSVPNSQVRIVSENTSHVRQIESFNKTKFSNLEAGEYQIFCTHPNYKFVDLKATLGAEDHQSVKCLGNLTGFTIRGQTSKPNHLLLAQSLTSSEVLHTISDSDGAFQIDGLSRQQTYSLKVFS